MTDADAITHLSESDRHALADGTLPSDRIPAAARHLAVCESCAADVGRIAALMTRVRTTPDGADETDVDELWPAIRARIDDAKVVRLAAPGTPVKRRRPALTVGLPVAIAAAAAIMMLVQVNRSRSEPSVAPGAAAMATDSMAWLVSAVDSANAVEEEAQALMAHLELQRAILRPEAAKVLDRDLRAVDNAINEIKVAIAHDPVNRELRQLLAASYRP